MPPVSASSLSNLAAALRRRLAVIANHALRDSDPTAHLGQLQAASEEIWRLHAEMGPSTPPQLAHFLESQSYQKALVTAEALMSRAAQAGCP